MTGSAPVVALVVGAGLTWIDVSVLGIFALGIVLVLLVPFTHHDVASPYRASGPIFVRSGARTANPAIDEVPLMFRHRLLSIRAYDAAAMMVDAEVVQGSALEDAIRRCFAREGVSYLHIHNARPGCYNCRVVRA